MGLPAAVSTTSSMPSIELRVSTSCPTASGRRLGLGARSPDRMSTTA